MALRPATLDDLDAIMQLERRNFPTDAWSEQTMRAEVASPHNHYLVDAQDARIIGYGGLRALRGSADSDIQTIALDAEFRGQGRGRALLRALIAEAVARRAKELFLEVRADNAVAESLYLSEGFTELGRRPRYYQPDDVDAVVMRLDLRRWAEQGPRASEEKSRIGGAIQAEAPPITENSSEAGGPGGPRQAEQARQAKHPRPATRTNHEATA